MESRGLAEMIATDEESRERYSRRAEAHLKLTIA
jgi:hypothetical protein